MSAEGVLALLSGDRPAGWLQYLDGSWAPVAEDGRVGPPITAEDLIEVAQRDLSELVEAGFITEIIDIEPLEVVDVEYGNQAEGRPQLALECESTDRPKRRNT
ncbi:hypothetical protein ACFXHA_45305 [Nocardia sp. NPDC059240]|uniref:hypothetical protein n=1 Tax=Nocardia sp. NPDC059240 TaxID=3346786 RepID=UPI003685DD76